MKGRPNLKLLSLIAGVIFICVFIALFALHVGKGYPNPLLNSFKGASLLTLLFLAYETFLFFVAGGADDK